MYLYWLCSKVLKSTSQIQTTGTAVYIQNPEGTYTAVVTKIILLCFTGPYFCYIYIFVCISYVYNECFVTLFRVLQEKVNLFATPSKNTICWHHYTYCTYMNSSPLHILEHVGVTWPSMCISLTFTTHELVTTCFASTTSTNGSVKATFLMQLMSKPYTLSHPAKRSFILRNLA